jgi:hypothetical protein
MTLDCDNRQQQQPVKLAKKYKEKTGLNCWERGHPKASSGG